MNAFIGLLMCSLRDLDSAAAAAAARMDSCKFEVDVTEVGVLGGEDTPLERGELDVSSLDGELSRSVAAGLCKTIIFDLSKRADLALFLYS